jgi:dolichol-phosphate mannosyltransferase
MNASKVPFLSVVIPIFNEEESLNVSLDTFRNVLDTIDYEYEVVAVNDGSTDKTSALLNSWKSKWAELRVIELISNSGHMAAITAGLENSRGNWIITIDVDLQDPPNVIPEMLTMAIEQKIEVVYGVRDDRSSDSWFKRTSAEMYYRLLSKAMGMYIPMHAADCRMMSRRVVDCLISLPEKQKVYRLLVPSLGFTFQEFKYTRDERVAGKTHYSTRKMLTLAITSITSFSTFPLRVSTYFGFLGLLIFLLGLIYVLYGYSTGNTSPGWASIILVVLFMGATQLISIGILGRYVANLYTEAQGRPIYLLSDEDES